jgi:hypothetical protein
MAKSTTLTLFVNASDAPSNAAREVLQSVVLQLAPEVGFSVDAATPEVLAMAPVLMVARDGALPVLMKVELASNTDLLAALERAGVPLQRR